MIKPNWDIFKVKFSDNPQNNFEWFCYLLFCKEFNQKFGIFRYKNQSAIETDPIEIEGQFIGWQAKFYETALTQHKADLLGTIKKAKDDYPDVSKIYLYSNTEWTQYRGKKTKAQKEIESLAKGLDIELRWRTKSYFESEFVTIDNEIISRHFFSSEKSIFNSIQEQENHSATILKEIQTAILFNDQTIEIDRSDDLKRLKEETGQVIILSGVAGVGKTALLKWYYRELKGEFPFYIFKATEFDISNINDLFTDLSFEDFANSHSNEENKFVIIDSAEKLLDLKNTDPFKEFLSYLVTTNWKLIFTTRDNYLEDLNFQFFEIYMIAPLNIKLRDLEIKELKAIADRYEFSLPQDLKLSKLIKNPFYLNKFLQFYKKDQETNYTDFKENLWKFIIKKTKPAREQCFLKIAFERANEGNFFVNPDCEQSVLDNELKNDGVLGHESPYGYFITHDIYEEWALENIVESEFVKKENILTFFEKIGSSLPIRRSFRKWVSEKLLLENNAIKAFVEEVVDSSEVQSFWKDEVLISVLLSDYSEQFFKLFRDELFVNEQALLKKLCFHLRIACKEIDDSFFGRVGISINIFTLKFVLTKPKGHGWISLIKFVYDNLDNIGIKNIYFVLPIIHDWNRKYREGETTRLASLIALRYYQYLLGLDHYYSRDDTQDKLLQTILYGSSEIKDELRQIFEFVINNKLKNHGDPYYDLCQIILRKIEGIDACKVLPKHIMQIADLFWAYTPKENDRYQNRGIGVERYFGMEDEHSRYFPASSFQTPTLWLIKAALKDTIDFIISFTNKAVSSFANSNFAEHEVKKVEVIIDNDTTIKQYICNRLWCLFRGSQAAPMILESMHMALEKFFLETGKHVKSNVLESWLKYLLVHSKSASVSAIVASIVMAYPEKTFSIAKILFKTKDFFFYDTARYTLDQTAKSHFSMGYGLNFDHQIHQDERIQSCDQEHRKFALENLCLNYQVFKSKETTKEEFENRQKDIWEILDCYYDKLPEESDQTKGDKTWRLYLARMDRRKMKFEKDKVGDQVYISMNPEIDPKLKEFSEKSLEKYNTFFRYVNLQIWSHYKFERKDEYKKYEQYEKNPKLALKQMKEIVKKLKKIKTPDGLTFDDHDDKGFHHANYSIPAYVSAVLLEDHIENLSISDKKYCKEIIFEYAQFVFNSNYSYQISDGTHPAIFSLPKIIREFPDEKDFIKNLLLLILIKDDPINAGGNLFCEFAIGAVLKLWDDFFNDAHALFLGYLVLKQNYTNLTNKIRHENRSNSIYGWDKENVRKRFLKENNAIFKKVQKNEISIDDLGNLEKYELSTLQTAFLMIPNGSDYGEHKEIILRIISVFSTQLLARDHENRIDYSVRHKFLNKYAYFVLKAKKHDIEMYLKPFLDNFNGSEPISELFKEFISAEDYLNAYENFWIVWNTFKDKIIKLCEKGDHYGYVDRIVMSYLFANNQWNEKDIKWHTLKDENKRFFKTIAEQIGHCPSTLYSLSKLLNSIGSNYLIEGVGWISNMIKNNKNLHTDKLENHTLDYIENLLRKYIYKNRENIRKTKQKKKEVLIILDFLIGKASVVGYMLRENIL
ncbi:MAG: ATP-binding protein [Desulfobacteraceae bacterium]|nr:ATP-binding protein [Desulfobacteraceae bacterium]